MRALIPAPAPPLPPRFAERLPVGVARVWDGLSPFDRRHLVAVALDMEDSGKPRHVVLAGLLHDIGKAGHITILDRVAAVLLNRLAPGLRDRLASRQQPPPGLNGLHLLLRHAERGADMLANAGMPEDVVWLVRHHEHEADCAELRALQAADHRH